jgi:hypothetical protein
MAEQLDISLMERQRCAIEFWKPNGSEAHEASYPMGTRVSFPGGKTAGTWSWPLTSS